MQQVLGRPGGPRRVSCFILMADDPSTIQRWGGEVAPALREAVDREREEAGTSEAGGAAPPHRLGAAA